MVEVKFDNGESVEILSDRFRIVSGWASVQIKDIENHVVSAVDLVKAMIAYMVDGGILLYGHTNTPVGRVIYWDLRKHEETGELGVYIVAQIANNNEIQDKVWEMVKSGQLKGFSIGGYGKPNTEVMKNADGTTEVVKKVTDIILKEISIVEQPANEKAVIEAYNELAKGFDIKFPELAKAVEDVKFRAYMLKLELGNVPDKYLADYFAMRMFEKAYDELHPCLKEEVAFNVYEFVKRLDSTVNFVKGRERDPCKEKYFNYDTGRFKGGKGERFNNCVKYQMECRGYSKEDAEALCAYIGRKAGKIK